MSTPVRLRALLPLTLSLGAACGPIQSTALLVDAEAMLEAAEGAQAPRHAPYEWTAATLYVQKAKEEVGYSDYEQAVAWARKAVEFATRARDGALKASRRAEPEPAAPPPVTP